MLKSGHSAPAPVPSSLRNTTKSSSVSSLESGSISVMAMFFFAAGLAAPVFRPRILWNMSVSRPWPSICLPAFFGLGTPAGLAFVGVVNDAVVGCCCCARFALAVAMACSMNLVGSDPARKPRFAPGDVSFLGDALGDACGPFCENKEGTVGTWLPRGENGADAAVLPPALGPDVAPARTPLPPLSTRRRFPPRPRAVPVPVPSVPPPLLPGAVAGGGHSLFRRGCDPDGKDVEGTNAEGARGGAGSGGGGGLYMLPGSMPSSTFIAVQPLSDPVESTLAVRGPSPAGLG